MSEPMACPFCGGKATVALAKKTYCQLHGEPSQAVIVGCINRDCQATPSVQGGDVFNGGYDKAKAEAIAKWNTRTPAQERDQ